MITGALKQQVDKLWEEFWTGGITNPLTVIEQISFLAFSRLLDMRESTEEKKWKRTNSGKPFPGVLFSPKQQQIRWSSFIKEGDPSEMLRIVRDEVFPHFKTLGGKGSTFGEYMADSICMINKASLLVSA